MKPTQMLVLVFLMLAACAPAGEQAPAVGNEAAAGTAGPEVEPMADKGPATGIDRNVTREPPVGPDSRPLAVPVPDMDPVTGINRNVTYEPQIGPEAPERPRKDARTNVPQQ